MNIRTLDILSLSGAGMNSDYEGVQHVKSLPYLSVVQALEGSYDISIDGGPTFSTGEGGIFIAPAAVMQTITHRNGASGRMRARWAFIDTSVNSAYSIDDLFDFPVLLPASMQRKAGELIGTICSDSPIWEKYAAGYMLIGLLIETGRPRPLPDDTHMRIRSFVAANFDDDIGADDIAAHIHCSVSQVFRYTKKYFGMTPAGYINSVRMRRAAELLELTGRSIGDIAGVVGFGDTSYFTRLFRRTFGMPPASYRKLSAKNGPGQ